MSQSLPYGKYNFDRNLKLEDILNTPDDDGIGYFIEVELSFGYNIRAN